MSDEERRYHAAEIAEHLSVTLDEFLGWLRGEQGDDWPKPEGTDEGGPYWGVYDLSAWGRWFEEG